MDASSRTDPDAPLVFVHADDIPLDARPGLRTMTLRDDRLDFAGFGDAASSCRRRRARLRLIDQGRFGGSELEWLAEAGIEIHTSDRIGRKAAEIILIRRAAERGNAFTALFQHGPIDGPRLGTLGELGRSGVDIHTSNAAAPHDFYALSELAWDCGTGRAYFAYQHHGPLDPGLETLAGRGAWIHLTNASLASPGDIALVAACSAAARSRRAKIILHVETPPDPAWLADLVEAGVFLLFKTPASDYRSPLRPYERGAARCRLDPRSYYLFPDYVL